MKRTFRNQPEERWSAEITALTKPLIGCWRRGYEEGREGMGASGCPYHEVSAAAAAKSWFSGHNAGRLDRLTAESAAAPVEEEPMDVTPDQWDRLDEHGHEQETEHGPCDDQTCERCRPAATYRP